MLLMVPGDPLRPRRPDEHFAPEAEAARAAGMQVALVDHDALARPDGAEDGVARVPAADDAVYRGWMLSSGQYAAFAQVLARRGVVLRTTPQQYQRAHEFPGWYRALSSVTPLSVWTQRFDRDEFARCLAELGAGPAVLRDYVKSMKHCWQEAAFIPEVADTAAAWRVAERFLELRGEDAVGGFVLRRFARFTSGEARTWWVDGNCVLVTAHPDTPQDEPAEPPDLGQVTPLVRGLGLRFAAADMVICDDGAWRVVELGDGQVSDRPDSTPPGRLIAALLPGRAQPVRASGPNPA